jgi:hypothetical protein
MLGWANLLLRGVRATVKSRSRSLSLKTGKQLLGLQGASLESCRLLRRIVDFELEAGVGVFCSGVRAWADCFGFSLWATNKYH